MKISLWLLPDAADAPALQSQIEQFSQLQGRTVFAPHLTLYSPIETEPEQLYAALQAHCSRQPPLVLESRGISHSAQHYRCLVVEMRLSPPLLTWHEAIRKQWNPQDTRPFAPHISLLYALLPESTRQALLPQVAVQARYRFDRLAAIRTESPDPEGFAYQHWETLWELPLSKNPNGKKKR